MGNRHAHRIRTPVVCWNMMVGESAQSGFMTARRSPCRVMLTARRLHRETAWRICRMRGVRSRRRYDGWRLADFVGTLTGTGSGCRQPLIWFGSGARTGMSVCISSGSGPSSCIFPMSNKWPMRPPFRDGSRHAVIIEGGGDLARYVFHAPLRLRDTEPPPWFAGAEPWRMGEEDRERPSLAKCFR